MSFIPTGNSKDRVARVQQGFGLLWVVPGGHCSPETSWAHWAILFPQAWGTTMSLCAPLCVRVDVSVWVYAPSKGPFSETSSAASASGSRSMLSEYESDWPPFTMGPSSPLEGSVAQRGEAALINAWSPPPPPQLLASRVACTTPSSACFCRAAWGGGGRESLKPLPKTQRFTVKHSELVV